MWCLNSSLIQLSNLSENEDALLDLFASLPQLKQVTSDKEELIMNIVEMASKFHFCFWSKGTTRYPESRSWERDWAFQRLTYCVTNRKKPSSGASAGRKETRDAVQGNVDIVLPFRHATNISAGVRGVCDVCFPHSLNSWPRWSRPLRRGCRDSMNSARQETRPAAPFATFYVSYSCSFSVLVC